MLIHSGAIIQITSIVETSKNQFNIKGKVISSGWEQYFQNVMLSSNTDLDLRCSFGQISAKENMQLLKQTLIGNKCITRLHLVDNGFGLSTAKDNMQLLKEALIENKSINILDLTGNDFGTGAKENMQFLTEALIKNKNITTLNLSTNSFGTGNKENMKLLKEVLIENKNITDLDLSWNHFGSVNDLEGGISLMLMREKSSGLTDKKNMQLLKEALIENYSITTLNLYKNGFGDPGAIEMRQLLMEILLESQLPHMTKAQMFKLLRNIFS